MQQLWCIPGWCLSLQTLWSDAGWVLFQVSRKYEVCLRCALSLKVHTLPIVSFDHFDVILRFSHLLEFFHKKKLEFLQKFNIFKHSDAISLCLSTSNHVGMMFTDCFWFRWSVRTLHMFQYFSRTRHKILHKCLRWLSGRSTRRCTWNFVCMYISSKFKGKPGGGWGSIYADRECKWSKLTMNNWCVLPPRWSCYGNKHVMNLFLERFQSLSNRFIW